MNWLSFFIGVLVGWVIELIIDYLFWRRRLSALKVEMNDLQSQLAASQAENARLQSLESDAADLSNLLDACEGDRQALILEVDELKATLAKTEHDLAVALEAPAPETKLSEVELEAPDLDVEAPEVELEAPDLEVEAPEIELEAPDLGVEAPEVELEAPEVDMEAPEIEFPERTGVAGVVATRGEEIALSEEPSAPDDLRKIEGIGPKISQILNAAGIYTFSQLANANVETLREILENAGSRFRLANPETWAEQAQLAAKGDWDALEALQDSLKGGRR